MKVMLLAAGLGSRLGAIGQDLPKCLVSVTEEHTLLDLVFQQIACLPIDEVIINGYHRVELLEQYIATHRYPYPIRLSKEPLLLGTGGALTFARDLLKGAGVVLVHNTDSIHTFDLRRLLQVLDEPSIGGVLLTARRESQRVLLVDNDGCLLGHRDKSKNETRVERVAEDGHHSERAFQGVSIFRERLLDTLKFERDEFSLITFYLKAVAAGEKIVTVDIANEYWIDAGTPERLEQLRLRLAENSNSPL